MNRLDERLKERARREDCPVPQGFDGRMDAILEGLPEGRLDERLKERARREDCPVPQGFDGRMDAILEGLPEGRRKPGPRRLRRWVVAGVLAAALCVGGVAAASGALELIARPGGFGGTAEGFQPYSAEVGASELIARPGGFGGTAEGFQPYSAEVGASVTDQGYTLTLDGIGVDEAFITLYATVTGEEPIPRDDRGEPELWSFSLKAEGKELEFWGRDRETEWVDDYTLKVMQRCPVARTLPDVVELQVYTNELFYGLSGDWSLNLLVDKTAPDGESLVVEPRQTFTMLDHRVRADKVVVAPSGGGLVLTEVGFPPLTDFLLRDDTGHYLYVDTERYGGAGGWLPISNFIAFYGGRPDMESITLVPYERVYPGDEPGGSHEIFGAVDELPLTISNFIAFYGGRPDMESITLVPYERVYPGDEPGGSHEIFGAVDELPLTDDSAETGYTLISLDIGAEQAVARFQTGEELLQYEYGGFGTEVGLLDGGGEELELGDTYLDRSYDWETGARFQTGEELLQYEYGGFGTEVGLLDGGGEELELGDTYLDRSYDWETGVWTVTLSYPDADPAELAWAEQLWFWQPNDTIRVLEDEAVTIPLS